MTDRTGRDSIPYVVSLIETWQTRRVDLAKEFKADGYRKFCETMNGLTRQLITAMDRKDPEFWTALQELAVNAGTLTTRGAKLTADGRNMTDA